MFSNGFNPTSNLGLGFNLMRPYAPDINVPSINPQAMGINVGDVSPTPMGGASTLMPSTANGVGGASAMPGNPGGMSPGNIMQSGAGNAATPNISWPGMGAAMQAQQPAGGASGQSAGMNPSSLAQMGAALMAAGQPHASAGGMPSMGVQRARQTPDLASLLAQYGAQGLLGG